MKGEKVRERQVRLVQVVEQCNHHYPIIIKAGKMAGRPIGAHLQRVGVNCRWGPSDGDTWTSHTGCTLL